MDGVDVRLLVPNATDILYCATYPEQGISLSLKPVLGYLNGTAPIHAKTAVADGHWARVGSTNLNIASWIGNY